MKLLKINDTLAPIRLLRQVNAITDVVLAEFLADEQAFKQQAAAADERWIDVFDCRKFSGLTPAQRETCVEWLAANFDTLQQVSLGVAFAVPAGFEARALQIVEHLDRLGLPTKVSDDIDTILDWALELAYDEEVQVDPTLILGGPDVLRQTLD